MYTCSGCQQSSEKPRLPNGWKGKDKGKSEHVYCGKCWRERYVLRAITLSVASPITGTWDDFSDALHKASAAVVSLSNWAVTELAKADTVRTSRQEKLAKYTVPYLYGLAAEQYPDWEADWTGNKNTAQSVFQAVTKKYLAKRLDIVWRRAASLPTYRYPQPVPAHNRDWKAQYSTEADEGISANSPLISFPLAGQRWQVRLRGGHEWARQLQAFRQIVSGDAIKGELAVMRQGSSIMVKLVAWLPRRPRQLDLRGQMMVYTGGGAFLTATTAGEVCRPWYLNGDHIRRAITAHRKFLDRISEDTKHEKRWPRRQREQINRHREIRCDKQHRRLTTWCHQASAQIAGLAQRRKIAEVIYDDKDKSFLGQFPWAQLKTMLATKLDEAGIKFTIASGEVVNETEGTARGE